MVYVANAKSFLQIQQEYGSFDNYIWKYVKYKTIISRDTYKQLPAGYVSHEIGTIKVKGKEEPITIYSPKMVV